ncbi:MAG: rRNA pseudouridine516 synthase [Clostridiales bacterium]|nr:rRNA pseudouridine516 synthase [Clostridiales bacterium]
MDPRYRENGEKMTEKIRLDKYLVEMELGTRSEVKKVIRAGGVVVDGEVIKAPETKLSCLESKVCYQGEEVSYSSHVYFMLNKPAGVVSATEDKKDKTVLDLLFEKRKKDIFPVGRLDKDTEGLLLLTDDGALAHDLLSPKKHVDKVYYARVEGIMEDSDIDAFMEGIWIDSETKTKPAKLEIQSVDKVTEQSEVTITLQEGKFHQVKRMVEAVGKRVTYLKRLSMGTLILDESLLAGEYRSLTTEEVEALKNRSTIC